MFRLGKKNARIDDFGIQLANELAKRVPLESGAPRSKKKGNEKYAKAIDHALGLTVAFQRDNKLGVYGKARLFNSFKWQLKRLGYPDDFVDTATAALVNFAANVRAGN
jgi:hypothetical protein